MDGLMTEILRINIQVLGLQLHILSLNKSSDFYDSDSHLYSLFSLTKETYSCMFVQCLSYRTPSLSTG